MGLNSKTCGLPYLIREGSSQTLGEIEFGESRADLRVDATGTERGLFSRIKDDKIYFTVRFLEKHKIKKGDLHIYQKDKLCLGLPVKQ